MHWFRQIKRDRLPIAVDWLLVGLGNPGERYAKTRHNIGFEVLDRLAAAEGWSWRSATVVPGLVTSGLWHGASVILLKPTTYMNLSGQAVQPLVSQYPISLDRLMVVYDDMALPVGRLRIRLSGSAGGHNGMKSIIQKLSNRQDFPRLRLGVGLPQEHSAHEGVVDHVLGKFSDEEQPKVTAMTHQALEALAFCMQHPVAEAMNRFNGAPPA